MLAGWVTTDEVTSPSASSVMVVTSLIIRAGRFLHKEKIHVQPKYATGSCATDLLENVGNVGFTMRGAEAV